jgi:hypothetical protein
MRRLLIIALLLLPCLPLRAQEVELAWGPGRGVLLNHLPDVLADQQVRQHLDSGLTTTFALQAKIKDRSLDGGARLEIRFEPWDEVFHVAAIGIDHRVQRKICHSPEELRAWWRGLNLLILASQETTKPTGRIVLRMDVIPFSASERSDTLRWLSDLRASQEPNRSGSEQVAGNSAPLVSQTVQVLLATSIRRQAIKTFRWDGVLKP